MQGEPCVHLNCLFSWCDASSSYLPYHFKFGTIAPDLSLLAACVTANNANLRPAIEPQGSGIRLPFMAAMHRVRRASLVVNAKIKTRGYDVPMIPEEDISEGV
jgi:hypothetical protein